ncbi:acyl-CoA thioester hydrolase/BAAT C-terminal domain-containing protein [Halostella litorea]|uniref:acyl-CoA thioester hydrolase/BAAT C-terminal domain-containing protein n=1 Tax=Halostella litorea TaxID=2528831 RepID=UPI0010928600|nr:acyl-CoA thioesterase/bile acid-CoA:amino acid N-acyltransferase family protein [Halostella litorea]
MQETETDPTASTADEQIAIRAPDRSRNDEPISVRITGADAGATVEFEAALTDDDGVEWRSRASFTADGDGVVDLTETAPDDGSYEGVAPMGWLWSMTADADVLMPELTADPEVAVDLRATSGGERAERTIVRELYDEGITKRPVDRDGLVGTLYEPAGDGPHPGVLSLHGSGGQTPVRTVQLLASHGFAVLAVQYFGEAEPIPDEHRSVPLSYFDEAASWLRAQPSVRDGQLGAVGGSRGGELALLLGARFDWIGAVVAYAGSGVAWDSPSGEPGWVHDGEAVPHLEGKDIPRETVEAGLADEPVDEATIAVERTDGPVLLITGDDDQLWPAGRLSRIAMDRLDAADHGYEYEHRSYEGAGHLISVPYVPTAEFDMGGGTPSGTARAAADSWPAVLEYLERGLDATEGWKDR